MLKEFRNLTINEVKRFNDFIHSPYFNKSKSIIKFFSYLYNKYPDLTDEDLGIKTIKNYLSANGAVSEVYCRKIISRFNNIFELFLTYEEINKNEVGNKLKLLESLSQKRNNKYFVKHYEIAKKQNSQFLKNSDFYLNEVLLNEQYIVNHLPYSTKGYKMYQEFENNLDLFFILSKVQTFNYMRGIERYFNKKIYKMSFRKEIFEFIKNNNATISKSHPYLYLEYLSFRMHETYAEKDENNFIKYFKSLKINNVNEELVKLFLFKLEYYYKFGYMINLNPIYYSKLLELYRWSYIKDYFKHFFVSGVLTETIYSSIISLALMEKDSEFASVFINETRKVLDPVRSNDMYYLAKAKLSFFLKKYDECFLFIQKIKLNDSFYYFQVKILLAKIFFEKKEFENAESVISSMEKYFKVNKKIRQDQLIRIKSDLIIFKKILKFAREKKYKKLNVILLQKEILNFEKMDNVSKTWYLEALHSF